MQNIYEFTVTDNAGEAVNLSKYEGKVLLIVNTATGCGFTPQYEGLQKLYEKYHDQGFEILDFPCNQFLGQAKGSDAEIHTFCTMKYHTTFPRFKKIEVNGKNADPLFVYLKEQKHGMTKSIKWNFTKFLVSKSGEVLQRFAPTETPESFEQAIIDALAK